MPTYEYACTQCGQHIEVFQRVADEPLATCGACGGPLRKVFHPAGILFKGSGFYATDSRAKSKAGSDASESSSSKGETKTEAKGETKSEKKSETKASEKPAPKSDAAS